MLNDPAAAAAVMDPLRRRLLELLASPASAAGLAPKVNQPRQKVNYHLRELERLGLVREVGTQPKRGCTERLVEATAAHYMVDPAALGALGPDPSRIKDRFSWAYLVALAARAIRELAVLRSRADSVEKPLATFSLSVDVRFKDQRSLHAFSEELSNEVARLVAKHHDERATGGRLFRFFVGGHPAITKTEEEAAREAAEHARAPSDAATNLDHLKEAYE